MFFLFSLAVVFLDTVESGIDKDTLKKAQDTKLNQQKQMNKKILKVKINDDLTERHVTNDDSAEHKQIRDSKKNDSNNNNTVTDDCDDDEVEDEKDDGEDDDVPAKRNESDTQTQSDLEQLRKLYMKNLEVEYTNQFNHLGYEKGRKSNNFDKSNFIKNVTNELEEQALRDILNELKMNNISSNSNSKSNVNAKPVERTQKKGTLFIASKPPKSSKKYSHIKGSGYGKTNTWTDNQTDTLDTSGHIVEIKLNEGSVDSKLMPLKNNINTITDIDYLMEQISNLMREREQDRNKLIQIKGLIFFKEIVREVKKNFKF